MPRWVLGCPGCNKDFTHSEIKLSAEPLDPFMWLGDKPEFPVGGLSLQCPNCKATSTYQRNQLVYAAT